MLERDPHPLAHLAAIICEFPGPIGRSPSPPWLLELLKPDAAAPLKSSDSIRTTVRDVLRHGGYKPTGRGKPASEYLLKAAAEGLSSINPAVDLCNAVSLHSGLPISVVDLDRVHPPLRISVAAGGSKYVFNASGQEIDLGGLICLFDAEGPCANAVKDSQRTKTHAETTRTLSILWGAKALTSHVDAAARWYVELAQRLGVIPEEVALAPGG